MQDDVLNELIRVGFQVRVARQATVRIQDGYAYGFIRWMAAIQAIQLQQ